MSYKFTDSSKTIRFKNNSFYSKNSKNSKNSKKKQNSKNSKKTKKKPKIPKIPKIQKIPKNPKIPKIIFSFFWPCNGSQEGFIIDIVYISICPLFPGIPGVCRAVARARGLLRASANGN